MGPRSSPTFVAPRRSAAARVPAVLLAWAALLGGTAGCSQWKKLSSGGSPPEVLFYDVLGQDRSPEYYYKLVRDSHNESDFCYRCGTDPFLVDKNIDALEHLGDASFARLEGEAQVVELLQEVVSEDRSALARATATDSLTKIGIRLPHDASPGVEDDGSRLLAASQELDRIYGTGAPLTPAARARARELITEIGTLTFPSFLNEKNALKIFYGRRYLVDEKEPAMRKAIDAALVRRMDGLIRYTIRNAVEDASSDVRTAAIRGLKTMGDRKAVDVVVGQLAEEPDLTVELQAIEYLGKVGTRDGVKLLIHLLDDSNASVRHKAEEALSQIAGADYGFRASNWKAWARHVDPGIRFEDEKPPKKAAAAGPGGSAP